MHNLRPLGGALTSLSKPKNYRSKSYGGGGNMQIEPYYGTATSNNDFRSHSLSYPSSSYYSSAAAYGVPPPRPLPGNLTKGKSSNGSTSNSWNYNDPEFQRKRRVASYKVYTVEGKVKGSFRKSFRWLKGRYAQVVYGWW